MLAYAVGLGLLSHPRSERPAPGREALAPAHDWTTSARATALNTVPTRTEIAAAAQPAEQLVRQWLDTVEGGAPDRAAAIWNLGSAAKEMALPALRGVARTGSMEERDIALAALGMLARVQGDDDGSIRAALRDTIYHGDDDDVLFTARATLDDVENQISQPAPYESQAGDGLIAPGAHSPDTQHYANLAPP